MEERDRTEEQDAREAEERPGAEQSGKDDEHSQAPGETGTGSGEGDPEHGKPYRQYASSRSVACSTPARFLCLRS